jgi:response regulator RpfG family c-di-GMP phosphodiesterase
VTQKILLVDDDRLVLASYHQVLRKRFDLDVALGGSQALQALYGHGPYAVLIADMQMPGMNGVELFEKVTAQFPSIIRIMLTGNQDQSTAMEAINQGRVFRFLTKPCSPDELGEAIVAALRQHRLESAEHDLLEQTLIGSLKALMEILAVVDPRSFDRAEIIRLRSQELAKALMVRSAWEVIVAAMLARLGFVTVPPELIVKMREREALSAEEYRTLQAVPEFGARLLERIPRMEGVAMILRYQNRDFSGGDPPLDNIRGQDLPMGARILRVVSDFQDLMDRRGSRLFALEQMKLNQARYDPQVLQAMEGLVGMPSEVVNPAAPRAVSVGDLQVGMLLTEDVKTGMGLLVAPAGTHILGSHLEKIQTFDRLIGLAGPIWVREGT